MTFVESLGNAFRRIKGLKTLDDFFEKVNPNDKVIVRALSQKSGENYLIFRAINNREKPYLKFIEKVGGGFSGVEILEWQTGLGSIFNEGEIRKYIVKLSKDKKVPIEYDPKVKYGWTYKF